MKPLLGVVFFAFAVVGLVSGSAAIIGVFTQSSVEDEMMDAVGVIFGIAGVAAAAVGLRLLGTGSGGHGFRAGRIGRH